ncbi:hypothetical protein I6N96_01095 [Enterococcus sp. BWM-S5]|uniref:Uncharacterized protein n=1 Tax=Enterococcus larvae TaxID=2794352 RepID=A0ABS4CF65_9ENTE|nr:hypothetical protein [Enterococcus larvae]MBP1044858.1 hypothetical protein [Enterococcus larvae]
MTIEEVKQEFETDLKKIESLKTLLDKLRSIDFFEGATVRNYAGTGEEYVYLNDEGECTFLNDAWSEKINSLIDEIKDVEKHFVAKWKGTAS